MFDDSGKILHKESIKKGYLPSLPILFLDLTRNTHIFFIWPEVDLNSAVVFFSSPEQCLQTAIVLPSASAAATLASASTIF